MPVPFIAQGRKILGVEMQMAAFSDNELILFMGLL